MFTKKTRPEPKPMATRNSSASSFSVLGADIAIIGDITASSDLHIDGRVEGEISCSAFVQGETSEIIGSITADSARLAGSVQGSVDVRELVILKSAQVHGDVRYDSLTIEQGAIIEGQLSPRGQQDSAARAVDQASGDEQQEGLLVLSSASS